MKESPENQEPAEVTEIIIDGKKYATVEEMPLALRQTYLQAMGASNEILEDCTKMVFTGPLTRHRTITIIDDHSPKAENADEDSGKPGLNSFLTILAGITVLYLMYILIPGRHEPWEKFITRQPTWESVFRGWAFFVLPISSFLWLGIYLFRGQVFDALSLATKIFTALLILLIIAMLLSALCW